MLTLENFEEASEIVKKSNPGDKADQKQLFFRANRKQSFSEAGEHAEDRRLQSAGSLL